MVRKMAVAAGLAAALAVPTSVQATHGGCLVHPGQTTCVYTALGAHQAAGYTDSTWEAYVFRTVGGVSQKVVIGGGTGAAAGEDVAAEAGEQVTLVLKSEGPYGQPVGVISAGNTAGHP